MWEFTVEVAFLNSDSQEFTVEAGCALAAIAIIVNRLMERRKFMLLRREWIPTFSGIRVTDQNPI
jgi:hypothetical protein